MPQENSSDHIDPKKEDIKFILIYRKVPDIISERKQIVQLWKADDVTDMMDQRTGNFVGSVKNFPGLFMKPIGNDSSQRKAFLGDLESQFTYAVSTILPHVPVIFSYMWLQCFPYFYSYLHLKILLPNESIKIFNA